MVCLQSGWALARKTRGEVVFVKNGAGTRTEGGGEWPSARTSRSASCRGHAFPPAPRCPSRFAPSKLLLGGWRLLCVHLRTHAFHFFPEMPASGRSGPARSPGALLDPFPLQLQTGATVLTRGAAPTAKCAENFRDRAATLPPGPAAQLRRRTGDHHPLPKVSS